MSSEPTELAIEAQRLRDSGFLARDNRLSLLFEFLLRHSVAGHKPKETEIAVEVFGRGVDFDATQDAQVRVYIHKLRRRLDEHYMERPQTSSRRIVLPKGEYRLLVSAPLETHTTVAEAAVASPSQTSKLLWITAAALSLSLTVNVAQVSRGPPSSSVAGELAVRIDQAPWSELLETNGPVHIVVGDYFIFGETDAGDAGMNVRRLVREFDINSPADLSQYLSLHPERSDQVRDLGLTYLPLASASALSDLVPVLKLRRKQVDIVPSSSVDASTLSAAHIIYIGYLSGMGPLLETLVFRRSRFSIGTTYDEIIDNDTGVHYSSQAGMTNRSAETYHDYGYLASFPGPDGNRILIVSGTRDAALGYVAHVLTLPNELSKLARALPSFEALYEVRGMGGKTVGGRLLVVQPLDERGNQIMKPR